MCQLIIRKIKFKKLELKRKNNLCREAWIYKKVN